MTEAPSFQQELQIEVKAGQTLVLEIVAKDAGSGAAPAAGGTTGSLQITIADAGQPCTVYLVGGGQSYSVPLDSQGQGRLEGIAPGTYELRLQAPDNNASSEGSLEITVDGASSLGRVYLAGSLCSYEVILDAAGKGRRDAIYPGSYELTLTRPANLGAS